MSGPSSQRSLVCEEVFDERSQPSEDEVREYAVRIGIDPNGESHLLPLAREGLLRPLPKNWKPVYDPATKRYYYFNFKTNQTSWEHPLDNRFRDLVKKSRSESISSAGEEDSKTSIKEELKSFEEAGTSIGLEPDTTASKDSLMDFPPHGVPALKSALSPLRTSKKNDPENFSFRKERGQSSGKIDLKPLFTPKPLFPPSLKDPSGSSDLPRSKPPKADWDDLSSYLDDDSEPLKQIPGHKSGGSSLNVASRDKNLEGSGSSVIGRFTVDKVHKIDIDSQTKRLDSEGSGSNYRSSDRLFKTGNAQPEFTLSGGGSVFLKSNKKKVEEKSDVLSKIQSGDAITRDGMDLKSLGDVDFNLKLTEDNVQDVPHRNLKSSIEPLTSSPNASISSTRSILRTPQGEKRLWDVDPQHMSVSEKALWRQQELEDEKKSVRFNLDKELNISFQLSDTSDADGASEPDSQLDDNDDDDDDDDGELEWNSKDREDIATNLKLYPKDVSNAQQVLKKEKRFSPLEEWAKETWFSKQAALGDKVGENSKVLNAALDISSLDEFGLPSGNLSQINDSLNHHEAEVIQLNSAQTVSELPKSESQIETGFSSTKDIVVSSDGNSSNELLVKKDVRTENMEKMNTANDSRKHSSPTMQENSSEANLAAALTRKLESLAANESSMPIDSNSRQAQAREQAFRDWSVKKTDGEVRRAPLSRQQSQQQLHQMKHQIRESSKKEDRDRALRDWNVTGVASESAVRKRSAPKVSEAHLQYELSAPGIISESTGSGTDEPKDIPLPVTEDRSSSESSVVAAASDEFEKKLSDAVQKMHLNYEERLKEKEKEFKLKFEKDQEIFIKTQQDNFNKRIEAETRNTELKFKEIVSQIEREHDSKLKQLREQLEHKQTCASQQILEQHQQALAAQEVENQAAMLHAREQFAAEIKALREQCQREEEHIRREHLDRVQSLREDRDGKRSKETTDHLRIIEKLRCEKRLVEDKYRILKEKYIKMKGEMKANLETKEKKIKENPPIEEKPRTNPPNEAEREIPVSQTQPQSDRSSETDSRPKTMSAGSSGTCNSLGFHQFQSQSQQQEQVNSVLDPPSPAPNSGPPGIPQNNNNDRSCQNASFLGNRYSNHPPHGKHLMSRKNGIPPPKAPWHSYVNASEKNGNIPTSVDQGNHWSGLQGNEFSPLEALRHQLQTLDELEEQFPASSVTDAYLRYPFSDTGCKELESAELEFFRHRIHLERDMIHQAKNSLHVQQNEYRSRMHNFQQRQGTSVTTPNETLHQMTKEEQELSDMEAKLRRTRTVLSEKMIHLRHLENSLNRLTAPTMRSEFHSRRTNGVPDRYTEKAQVKHSRRWDWKNGGGLGLEDVNDDISSDSGGSSGFSSTEYTSDGTLASLLSRSGSGRRVKKTPENTADINASLHNLNAEISEIWNVLCKQRAAAGLGPPPLLSTQASSWINPTSQQFTGPVNSVRTESPTPMPSVSKATSDKSSSLIERTNNLRQWLQKAKISATSPPGKDRSDAVF